MKTRRACLAMLFSLFCAQHARAQATETAIFAGGCFWSMEAAFEKVPGVLKAESGYTGGHVVNPSYEQVGTGSTGHLEAVRVTYDSAIISYTQLLDHYWHSIDPTVKDRQFCDLGPEYNTAIFYLNASQHQAALKSKAALEQSGILKHVRYPVKVDSTSYPPEFQLQAIKNAETEARAAAKKQNSPLIQTEIRQAMPFYPAEAYHQDYAKKNPFRYSVYRTQCGRDARLQHIWGKTGQ